MLGAMAAFPDQGTAQVPENKGVRLAATEPESRLDLPYSHLRPAEGFADRDCPFSSLTVGWRLDWNWASNSTLKVRVLLLHPTQGPRTLTYDRPERFGKFVEVFSGSRPIVENVGTARFNCPVTTDILGAQRWAWTNRLGELNFVVLSEAIGPPAAYQRVYDSRFHQFRWRVAGQPETSRLSVTLSVRPETAAPGSTVEAVATASGAKGPLTYLWSLDGRTVDGIGNVDRWSQAFSQPGRHRIKVGVGDGQRGSAAAERVFEILGDQRLSLVLDQDKTIYLTGQKARLSGRFLRGSAPVDRGDVRLRIRRADGQVDEKSVLTKADGTFAVEYEIPRRASKDSPVKQADWPVEARATWVEPGGGGASATGVLTVAPVVLKLHSVRLVQVVDAPVREGSYRLAAGKIAGVRAMVSCPSIGPLRGISNVVATVMLDVGWGAQDIVKEKREFVVTDDPTSCDFTFTLEPGAYSIGVIADPDFRYMPPDQSEEMFKDVGKPVRVEKTKDLAVAFGLVGPWKRLPPSWADGAAFCHRQAAFIRDVFCIRTGGFRSRYIGHVEETDDLSDMAEKAGLMAASGRWTKLVAVKDPSDPIFPKDKDVEGAWYPLCNRTLVYVKYGAHRHVSGHEVGHLCYLRNWPSDEEYDLPGTKKLGLSVTGLVLKAGRIYDLSKDKENGAAFNQGALQGLEIHCMMGPPKIDAWICDECHANLLLSLADPPDSEALLVSGVLKTDGSLQLNAPHVLRGVLADPPFGQGQFSIECLSADGRALYSDRFGGPEKGDAPVCFLIPMPGGTARARVTRGGQVVREFVRSAAPPTVRVIAPNAGDVIGEKLDVGWEASDPEGDPMRFSVLFSCDGGDSWTSMATGLRETRHAFDVTSWPGGKRCMIKVLANDGFNTAEDVCDGPFSMRDGKPLAKIESPASGANIKTDPGQPFRGWGFDPEDGEISDAALRWKSDRDGDLGQGAEIKIGRLSPGEHVITLSADDSAGNVALDSVRVTVAAALDKDTSARRPGLPSFHVSQVPSGVTSPLMGIAHGAGRFIAVGADGVILASTDGRNWRRVDARQMTGTPYYSVGYGQGRFVAVGYGGTISTSEDGERWAHQDSGVKAPLFAVAFGAESVVVVGYAGTIVNSRDATAWSRANSGSREQLMGVCSRADRFIAVGYNGTMLVSPEGSAWSAQRSGTRDHMSEIVSLGGRLFALRTGGIAKDEDPDRGVLVSDDGLSWRTCAAPVGLNGMALGGGVYLAVGHGPKAVASVDGDKWSQVDPGTDQVLQQVAFGNGIFVAVGETGTIVVFETIGRLKGAP